MNNNINIAEILKDYPKGTKLYSPLFGEVALEEVDSTWAATVKIRYKPNSFTNFFKTGLYYNYEGAECLLFPSSEMRDWSKLSWKKGDVLICKDGKVECIFVEFIGNNYTSFKGVHCLDCTDENNFKYKNEDIFLTENYFLEIEATAKCYINTIEERLGGKLNPQTLNIEPIKSKCEFKPFDRVLVRNGATLPWKAEFFSSYDPNNGFPYSCIGNRYIYCISYEGNEHLINTTKDY